MLEWLRNAVRRLRSRTQPQEPFDFRSYEFPRLDVDRTANELRLLEQA
jgi:hypothetical protein